MSTVDERRVTADIAAAHLAARTGEMARGSIDVTERGEAAGAHAPEAGDPPHVDPAFRNGSVAAIGVVVGFSLNFLSNWVLSPGSWKVAELLALGLIGIGVALQIRSLAGMLGLSSLVTTTYNRLVRIFLIGLIMASSGVVLAIVSTGTGVGRFIGRVGIG